MSSLHKTLKDKAYDLGLTKPTVPDYIGANLKHALFEWQKEAFTNLLTYQAIREKEGSNTPTHLLFNMATGAGKTLLMAATMLYYYRKGYRHFLFFVSQTTIVDKTENNFINNNHSKYLFKDNIVIGDKTVPIRKVDVFSDNPHGIEVKFTTIHKLYNDIHIVKENSTTLDDLHQRDIVMLADEAHHLNAKTQTDKPELAIPIKMNGRTSVTDIERKGWEHTVIDLILNKNGNLKNNENVLLEFTATVPANENVAAKYQDKVIYQFGLKEFLSKGYTKHINLISSTLEKKQRILHALLFHWYRHEIALKYGIANFKPVILFRSKTIEESRTDYNDFLKIIDNLSIKDFDFCQDMASKIYQSQSGLLPHEMGKLKTEQMFAFMQGKTADIVAFLKTRFANQNVIITNSADNKQKQEKPSEEQEMLLNSLEDKNNPIRAIFTVKRLTEGWDVLNLFDIVRLYQGQSAGGSNNKTPEATTQEKQLIGRGVRYYPFAHGDLPKHARKFDDTPKNELRILEELFYYTYDEESKYISHLKRELEKEGYINTTKILVQFGLKPAFKQGDLFRSVSIWYNEAEDKPQDHKQRDFSEIKAKFNFKHKLPDVFVGEITGALGSGETNVQTQGANGESLSIQFKDIEKHIVQKAISMKAQQDDAALYRFENLCQKLSIERMSDLSKDEFFGDIRLKISLPKPESAITNKEWLDITLAFLGRMESELQANISDKIGGDFKAGKFSKFFGKPKEKLLPKAVAEAAEKALEAQHTWYALDKFVGTREEVALVEFIKDSMPALQEKYESVWLLRNEEKYKIFSFKEGRGFQPDFLMLLKDKQSKKLYYQIFIEPKGEHIAAGEQWKENFLKEIAEEHGLDSKVLKFENKNYHLIGLPFYNTATAREAAFEAEFDKQLKLGAPKSPPASAATKS